ncbi:DNA-binding winged helix-turn-helix (wHTH) domain-containing protein [Colwellia chukchiensis]|uniref:DNA-binding winged helix-turn-helix (WHTH) domain-containing protein n=1 Tax=Colwellia chukchiensis TaxID=641665 RepID=A0A1H7TUI6_9GAMM|nr:winged helix-turn-helix domain-containing protein [Colwellia chukchiensis]SEL88313.1 DNA-binding winged helix-turn-helix (wHTH) domain-containing protein [Colwellia chukchiensis]
MVFEFGTFNLNIQDCSLTHNGQTIAIEPKIFALLCFFCQNPQRAISRDELIEKVWQGRIVSNAAINRAVGELRKIIETDVKAPHYIVTINKVGYRFNAELKPQTNNPDVSLPSANLANTDHKNVKHYGIYFAVIALMILAAFFYQSTKRHSNPDLSFELSPATPLTTLKGSAFKPQLFSNGAAIFLHRDSKNNNVQLWLQTANAAAQQLTHDSFYYTYAIFKDANTILATRFDNLNARNCQIIEINIASGEIKAVASCAKRAVTYLAFDANARKLYFNYRDSVSQPFAIRSLQLDTGRIQQLTHANPAGNARGDYLFALSANAEQMAILEYQQDASALLKITNINKPTQVARYQAFEGVSAISWLNHQTVLITTYDGVIAYDFIEDKSNYLIQGNNISQATYAPTLALLSYVKFDVTRNLYQRSFSNTDQEHAITHSAYANFLPSYANHSNALVYFSTDAGRVDFQHLDHAGKISPLNFPEPIKHFGNLVWSHDDSTIFASVNSKLFQYSMASAKWQMIATNLQSIHYIGVIDEQRLVLSSDDSGDWQLWQLDLTSAKATQLTKNGGYSANYHGRTKSLLLSKYSQAGLFSFDLASKTEVKLIEHFKITDWNKWQIRGDNIYYWQQNALIKQSINREQSSIIWQDTDSPPAHFSINFDATKIAYSVTEQEKSTIWKNTIKQQGNH